MTRSSSTSTRCYDGHELYIGGVMEHLEEAGIHSGDSSCTLPPMSLGRSDVDRVREATLAIAEGVGVRGLLNVQFAISAGVLYVIEANPRASRTVPFVSKALGIPMAKAASRIMAGATIAELKDEGLLPAADGSRVPMDAPVSVKEAVLPFKRFRTKDGKIVDSVLGPEMCSTGEVMGIDKDFPTAFAKSQAAAYGGMPTSGTVFISVADADKRAVILPAHRLQQLGFTLVATEGTAEILSRNGIAVKVVQKYSETQHEGGGENVVDLINDRKIDIVVNTPSGERRVQMAMRSGRPLSRPTRHCSRRSLCSAPQSAGWMPSARVSGSGACRSTPSTVRPPCDPATDEAPRFGERIRAARAARGPLCVGIDPHAALLTSWGLPESAAGVREFGMRTVDAAASRVGVVKPQVSFFERFGSAGFAALEDVLQAARDAGLVVIADAKRGDIGTTMDAYAAAWLTPGSPLEADALTVNPFLGVGSLDSTFERAERNGKGVFVLAATKQPRSIRCAAGSNRRIRPFRRRSWPR